MANIFVPGETIVNMDDPVMKKATDAYNSLLKIVKDLNLLLNTPNITIK